MLNSFRREAWGLDNSGGIGMEFKKADYPILSRASTGRTFFVILPGDLNATKKF
jgi:hypothetical protein